GGDGLEGARAVDALLRVDLVEGAALHERLDDVLVHAPEIHARAEVEEIGEGLVPDLARLADGVAHLEDGLERGLTHTLERTEPEADPRLVGIAHPAVLAGGAIEGTPLGAAVATH